MSTKGNRTAYFNVAEYALTKVMELLLREAPGVEDQARSRAREALEAVFAAREADRP